MKKNLILSLFALLAVAGLHAQITLSQTSYPSSVIGTDSLKKYTVPAVFPSLAPSVNATWDFSTVSDSTPVFFAYRVAPPAGVTSYQFVDSNYYSFSSYSYQGSVQSSITSTALLEYGINIPAISYSLSPSPDSIFIPAQTTTYTSPRTVIKFPATFNSSWTSMYSSDFDYQISYSPLPSHTPGLVRTYYTEKDTVIGWGKLRVKDASGSPSGYMNVLQVRTTIETVDSFSLQGSFTNPALPSLLTALSLTQGQKDTTYQMNFYRTSEVTPIAQVNFRDAAFTQTAGGTYHRQRLPLATAVATVVDETGVAVYPNPVNNSEVFIKRPSMQGSWSYELTGIDGRVVLADKLPASGGDAHIMLPPSITSGIYYLRLNNDGKQVSIKPLDIVK